MALPWHSVLLGLGASRSFPLAPGHWVLLSAGAADVEVSALLAKLAVSIELVKFLADLDLMPP